MPDISDLSSKVILRLWMNAMFRGIQPPTSSPALGLVVNYIRLVDKAVREYRYAQDALDELLAVDEDELAAKRRAELEARSPGTPKAVFVSVLSPIFRVSDHLENCIGAMKRAIDHAGAIRRDQDAPRVEKAEVPSTSDYDRLNAFRVAVEHTEPMMVKREIEAGDLIMVFIDERRLLMAKHELLLADLVGWIRKLHALSSRLASGDPPPQPPESRTPRRTPRQP